MEAQTGALWESILPVEEERGHVRTLLWRCVDLVVRDITSCAALDTLPLDVQAALLALVCRRRVCDRRLMRLFSPELHVGPNMLLHNMGFALSGLKVLSRFAHVARLDLSGEKALDCRRVGAVIARMRGLTSLNLRRYPHHLSLGDMKSIAGLTGLAELNLSRSRVEDAHVNLLAELSSILTSLDISHCRGLRGDLWALPKMTQLRALNISRVNLLPLVLDYLDQMTSLVRLNLSMSMWLRDTSRLAGLTQLEDLDLAYMNHLTDESLEGLLSLTRLRRLNLKGNDLSDYGLTSFLTNLHNLELLDLSNTRASTAPKKLLDQGGLPRLRQITVIQTYQYLTEGDLMAIKSSYPELRVMCNYTSFQDTVAWAFESPETTRDPDLCAQWLEYLRGRIYNGDTKDNYYGGHWNFRPRVARNRRPTPEPAASAALKKQKHKAQSYRESGDDSDQEDHRGYNLTGSTAHAHRSSIVRRAIPCLSRVLQLMTAHFDHHGVVNQGISLVRELSQCQALGIELAQELNAQEWRDFMYRCLWAYPSDAVTVKNVLKALPIVYNSAHPSHPQPRLIRALVEIMRTQSTDVAIVSRCVDVVHHISAALRQAPGPARENAGRYLELALTEGFVASMVCSIAQHPHQPRLLKSASRLVEHAVKSSFRERATDELLRSGFLEVFRSALAPFAKSHTTRELPYVVHGQRIIKMLGGALREIIAAVPKPDPGSWVKPSPVKAPKARKLSEILPAETKLDANRNRRRRKKQAKQSRQHFREVINRKKEKRDRNFKRIVARYKRRNYREEEAAKEEAYDRVCNVKEARGGQWWKNQKAKNLRLKKQHRGVPRTRERRGGLDLVQLSRKKKDLRIKSSYDFAADIYL